MKRIGYIVLFLFLSQYSIGQVKQWKIKGSTTGGGGTCDTCIAYWGVSPDKAFLYSLRNNGDTATKTYFVGTGGSGSSPTLDAVTAVGAISSRDIVVNGITSGRGAGNDANSSVFGNGSLSVNTTGVINNAFGSNSLLSNTTGGYNSAFGTFALKLNTTGSQNTAVGYGALRGNDAGNSNVAIGTFSLYSHRFGNRNVAIGLNAMSSDDSSYNNIAIGYTTLNNNKGNYNTVVGDSAGVMGATILHYNNITLLGAKSKPTQSNQVVLGDTAVTQVLTYGKLKSNAYGTGAVTGVATYNIATDASGNFIETALSGGGSTTVTSYGKNTSKDSTILLLSDGTRYAAKDSVGSGGSNTGVNIDSVVIITSGSSSTVPNNVNIVSINPSAVISSYALTLPTSWRNSNDVLISFGGTITSGNPVVTTLSIIQGSGQTLLQSSIPVSANAGEIIRYHLIGTIDQRTN